ncbi:hypothetical protein [Agrococcus sp. ProA11]|uniref:hypothetical protein n=1 Tax=Agrococcus chionoecetis TaxID=3153752 RepID=UPI003260F391
MRRTRVAEQEAQQRRLRMGALFLVFGSLGASAAAIPATLPAAIADAPEAAAIVGAAVPALFAGVLVGVVLSAWWARPPVHIAIAGSALQSGAFLGLLIAAGPHAMIALAALVGVGFGLVEASATGLVRDLDRASTARRLTALTGTVAIVAAALPLSVSILAPSAIANVTYVMVAVLQCLAAVALAITARDHGSTRPELHVGAVRGAGGAERAPIRLAAAGLALALAVGAESVLAGNSAIVPFVLLDLDPSHAAVGTTVFWILLASGRFAASSAMHAGATARLCLAVAGGTAAIALLVAAATVSVAPAAGTGAAALAVVAIGPMYSLLIGMALEGARARWAASALIAAGSTGGAALPFALLLAGLGAADAAMWIVLAAAIIGTACISAIASIVARRPHHQAT